MKRITILSLVVVAILLIAFFAFYLPNRGPTAPEDLPIIETVSLPAPPPFQSPLESTILFYGEDLAAWADWNPPDDQGSEQSLNNEPVIYSELNDKDARWIITQRAIQPILGSDDLITRQSFGGYHLHLDFLIPQWTTENEKPIHGNSGIFLSGKYEVQIADSSGQELTDLSCGAISGVVAPTLDAAKPAGEWQTLEVTYEEADNGPAFISVWLNGKQVQRDIQIDEPTAGGFPNLEAEQNALFVADEKIVLGTDNVSVLLRFRADGNGTLFSRAPAEGKWKPDAKAVFFRGDQLIYDIGWVGALSAGSGYNDGEWHTMAFVYRDRVIHLYVDGELKASREDFISEDVEDHVFKIGAASTNFAGDLEGDVSRLLVYERALAVSEIEAFDRGVETQSDAALDWTSPANRIRPHADFSSVGVTGPIRLQFDSSRVRFANIWLQPLPDVDHAELCVNVTPEGIERGQRIYDQVCMTCHGNKTQEGTLPTSRRFHEQQLESASDPYGMYKTLTRGYKQMIPQVWMTPQQKYDVIHYLREEILKEDNPSQYFEVTPEYLSGLPKGRSRLAHETTKTENPLDQYLRMNFGPSLNWTLQVAPDNIAYKGIAVRLDEGPGGVSQGNSWVLYDHDTMRVAAMWQGNFVDWRGIAFDGSHQTHTKIASEPAFVNPVGPGWAKPGTESFEDPRFLGRDGKPYGPLPRDWTHFRGIYKHGQKVVISYTVGTTEILELPELVGNAVLARSFEISNPTETLLMRVAPSEISVAVSGETHAFIEERDGFHVLVIPANSGDQIFQVFVGKVVPGIIAVTQRAAPPPPNLQSLVNGGPARWPDALAVRGELDVGRDWDNSLGDDSPYAIDTLTVPRNNPWCSWMRLGGFDFYSDGKRAVVCTWNGDVWLVSGIDEALELLVWKRIAAGLFQPLGVKIVDDEIYITCRDQIVKLHDLNGDDEIDYFENFNNDHQVTEHFHEFAMGLETDADGNFYYAKSARHALPALVPHHGTLIKVSKDGLRTEIVANGFRAANGVCVNDDGTFFVTDQEGHWTPKNRINWVKPGKFYGNYLGYHDRTDADSEMEQPLVWLTNEFDRSPAELLWVNSDRWGPLQGSLLAVSYGMGQVFVVPFEKVDAQVQGGQSPLQLPIFPTGIMRGRFNDNDGQLYVCGLFAWAGNRIEPGGFYRVRYTGGEVVVPVAIKAVEGALELTFSAELDRAFVENSENFKITAWDLKRSSNYGSQHFNERSLNVINSTLLQDNRTISLSVPDLAPTWGMKCVFTVRSAKGVEVSSEIHNTIHVLSQVESN